MGKDGIIKKKIDHYADKSKAVTRKTSFDFGGLDCGGCYNQRDNKVFCS